MSNPTFFSSDFVCVLRFLTLHCVFGGYEYSWMNTFKVANCGVCNKKMIIGIKCRTCK